MGLGAGSITLAFLGIKNGITLTKYQFWAQLTFVVRVHYKERDENLNRTFTSYHQVSIHRVRSEKLTKEIAHRLSLFHLR